MAIASGLVLGTAEAQTGGSYPQPQDLYVNDFVGLLSPADASTVRDLLTGLYTRTDIEAVVVTISSINDYNAGDRTIESFATNLFNTWGIGDAERNDGVLILVAVRDRAVRIELGSGYATAYNDDAQKVIDDEMLPSFRRSEYSKGIRDGTEALVGVLKGDRGGGVPSLATVGGAGAAAGVFGLSAFGFLRYRRRRARRCPNCQTLMTRLDEMSDDLYLDSGQKVEELLRSVDYDVWKCPTCGNHRLQGHSPWSSRLSQCPQCSYRTLFVESQVLVQATYDSQGTQRITRSCPHCRFLDEQIAILPRLVMHGSSGGGGDRGGFGGGHSSGGGATGRW